MTDLDNNRLSDKQLKVLDYIRNNPGQSKEKIIKARPGKYSRMSILNTLDKLEKLQYIVLKQINPQLYEIYPNEQNLLILLQQDLDRLERFIVRMADKFKDEKATIADSQTLPENKKYLMLSLFILFQHFVLTYVIHSIYSWPKLTSNQEILSELYRTLFHRLKDIYSKFGAIKSQSWSINLLQTIIMDFFMLTPANIQAILKHAEQSNMLKDFQEGLDIAWRASVPMLPWAKPNFQKYAEQGHPFDPSWRPKTWREAFKFYNDQQGT